MCVGVALYAVQTLANMGFVTVVCFGEIIKKVFLGSLRPVETEVGRRQQQ